MSKKVKESPGQWGLVGWASAPCTKRLLVGFPFGEHAWVLGLLLSKGHAVGS